jgi:hypothetical protein
MRTRRLERPRSGETGLCWRRFFLERSALPRRAAETDRGGCVFDPATSALGMDRRIRGRFSRPSPSCPVASQPHGRPAAAAGARSRLRPTRNWGAPSVSSHMINPCIIDNRYVADSAPFRRRRRPDRPSALDSRASGLRRGSRPSPAVARPIEGVESRQSCHHSPARRSVSGHSRRECGECLCTMGP